MLLVANQGSHSISLVDPLRKQQFATLLEDDVTVHELAVTPDGRFAFAPVYGSSGIGRPGTNGDTIDVFDLTKRSLAGHVRFSHGVRPHHPVFDPVSGKIYVTTELDRTISIVDPHTWQVVGTVPTGQEQSHMLAISHDGSRAYTANVGPGTVSVMNLQTHELVKVIPISENTQRISISNDDRMVFTADQKTPRLAVVDTTRNQVARWVSLPSEGYGTAATKDGRFLLVALRSTDRVAVLDLKTFAVTRLIAMPKWPTEILIRPDGKAAYISCTHSDQVAELNLETWQVDALIDVGKEGDGMAWAPGVVVKRESRSQ